MLSLSMGMCTTYLKLYNIVTSLFCYRLLKPHLSGNSEVFWNAEIKNKIFEATTKNKVYPDGFSFVPDIDNATSVAIACQGLTGDDCQRWLSCSRSARVCCQDYLALNISSVETPKSHCQPMWDGMSCVNSVPNGTVVSMKCPDYYIPAKRTANFIKLCRSNGTWDTSKLDVDGVHILTNYSACKAASKEKVQVLGADELRLQTVVTLATNVISLAFLLPSFALVTLLRNSVTSETEKRKLMIHFHFLGSLILVSVFTLSWDWIITKEHVEKLHTETSLIEQNSPICKVLLCLQIYMRSATYFWMFVEGLNILIPLCRAFQEKIQRRWLYFIGWGVPLSTIIIYAVIRTTIHKYDSKCWIYHYPEIEWIVFVPNYLTVLCNFVFLILIMANIIMKKQTNSSNRHRGGAIFPQSIRSLICLIFLFGINFIVPWIMYAVDSETIIPFIFNRVVEGLQGVFVCILWVFCSKEIQHNFKRIVQRKFPLLFQRFQGRKFSTSSHTHLTQAIYPVAAAPIVLDSSKVTERLERVLELPETERHSRETERLTTINTSSRNSLDVELPLRHVQLEDEQRTKGGDIPEKERLTGETERRSQELDVNTNKDNLKA